MHYEIDIIKCTFLNGKLYTCRFFWQIMTFQTYTLQEMAIKKYKNDPHPPYGGFRVNQRCEFGSFSVRISSDPDLVPYQKLHKWAKFLGLTVMSLFFYKKNIFQTLSYCS